MDDEVIVAYVDRNQSSPVGRLTDWYGKFLGTWETTGRWRKQSPTGGEIYTMHAIKASIGGKSYYGRYNEDGGNAVKLKELK